MNKDGSFAFKETEIKSGIIDRINPHPFGTPTPGDGILDPNDDISIQFNEAIDGGSLSLSNFDIRGVVNGITSNQSTSIYLDGLDDHLKIAEGINLQRRNFTLEFWAKKDASGTGEQAVLYQGVDPKSDVWFGFDASNKLKFELGDASVTTDQAVANADQWHHYAIVYDFANQVADLFIDGSNSNTNKSILHNYQGSGRFYIGKNAEANAQHFKGNVSDVRIWNRKRSNGEIVAKFNKRLNRNASGLLHNWKLDEAHGTFPKDNIRGKEAQVIGATWQVTPGGSSIEFSGNNQDVEITTSTVAITSEMDFTLEFWFKSNQAGAATLVSNGKGDGLGADSLYSWNIDKDASGKIFVRHRGLNFEAVSQDVFDDKWHHFALIMQRTGNLSAYLDGNLQNSVEADDFHSFSGTKMTLGARGYYVGSNLTKEAYFDGHIDEFRMWNTARKLEQIRRDMRNRLKGDEPGLQVFVPGESYTIQMNVPILTGSFNDFSPNALATTNNSAVLSSQTPTLKLPRPVQSINFVYSLNNDKIIITPTDAPELIENVTLDITVKNVKDKQGNTMQSPKTWIAYMNKNQVKWSNEYFAFDKVLDSNLQFTSQVVNTGGAATSFTISNLPSWLSASTTAGTIGPDASQTITFTISDAVNIGNFTQDIFLTTDFNFPEKLTVDLTVRKDAPNWNVNPSDYQFSMSIFGQLKMDDIISANEEDQLVAFINGEVRGKATLQYVSQYDHYVAFLNVYSNSTNSDSIEFKMWNAMKGEIYVDVVPELVFTENDIVGTPGQPQLFTGTNKILKLIPAASGWTWVSFPLNSDQFTSTDALFSEVNVTDGDVIKGLFAYDQYDQTAGWIGGISSNGGFNAASTYKVSLASADTIELLGEVAHPDSVNIVVNPGWNWVGFVSPKNLDIQTAMANYNAQDGDVLKSQFDFAYYDSQIGWVGSLSHLKSGQGYMLKASATDTFNFPISSLYGPSAIIPNNNVEALEMQLSKTEFEQNMSIVAQTNICKEWLDKGSIILGAFNKQNQLRGYTAPTWSEADNAYRFYLTAYNGFENEALDFVFYDSITGDFMSSSSQVEFASNTVVGSASMPMEVNIDEDYACAGSSLGLPIVTNTAQFVNVAPNPFETSVTIYSKGLPADAEYDLIDSYGKVVRTETINPAGETTITEAMLSAGVYFIRVTGSSFNKQIKVIKL